MLVGMPGSGSVSPQLTQRSDITYHDGFFIGLNDASYEMRSIGMHFRMGSISPWMMWWARLGSPHAPRPSCRLNGFEVALCCLKHAAQNLRVLQYPNMVPLMV